MLSFKVTKKDARLISAIADRAGEELFKGWTTQTVFDTEMDITAAHANGCPLKLDELLAARPLDFAHDVGGIRRHIDRNTGQLRDCFLPRFAIKQEG